MFFGFEFHFGVAGHIFGSAYDYLVIGLQLVTEVVGKAGGMLSDISNLLELAGLVCECLCGLWPDSWVLGRLFVRVPVDRAAAMGSGVPICLCACSRVLDMIDRLLGSSGGRGHQ